MMKYIHWLAYIALVIAFIIGYITGNDNEKSKVSELTILAKNHLVLGEFLAKSYSIKKNDSLFGYLAVGEAQGYGGPLRIAVISDTEGVIVGTELINDYESASFMAKLSNKKYFDQYSSKVVNNRFELKKDIDAVSGATVSSFAISEAIREASYKIAENNLLIEVPQIETKWKFTTDEGIALLIFVFGIVTVFVGKRKLRYLSLFLGFIFLGFLFNASLSITHFGRLVLGYFPDIHSHFIWWLLMGGTFTVIVGWGRNVYCSTLCPFHATQVLLNKLSGINLKLTPKLAKLLSKTPFYLLWLSLMLIFLSSNPTISSYEPFAMLFSLEGIGIQWYILPITLIGALFFSNFFCRFFCPVGATFRWVMKKRRKLIAIISNR